MIRHGGVAIAALFLGGACAREVSPPPAQGGETKTASANTAAPTAASDGAHAGCIYAGGEHDADPSCPHGGGHEPDAPAGGDGHFGAPFAAGTPVPLAKAIASGPSDAPVLVSGTVEAVCQKKGCWMVVKDGTESARVLMKDHGFAVPMDSRGKAVIVEGTLSTRTFDEAQVKHLEADKGGDPGQVSGTRKEHVLTASGVEIRGQS